MLPTVRDLNADPIAAEERGGGLDSYSTADTTVGSKLFAANEQTIHSNHSKSGQNFSNLVSGK